MYKPAFATPTALSPDPGQPGAPRVLLVIARYWPAIGGAELHSREMAQHLQHSGTPTAVFCHLSNQNGHNEAAILQAPARQLYDGDVEVIQRPYQGPLKPLLAPLAQGYPHWRAVRPLYNQIIRRFSAQAITRAARNADVVHNVYSGMTMVSEAACEAAQRLQIPFVFTPLARTCDGPKSAWATPRLKRLYARADAIIALTGHEKAWLVGLGVAADKIHVCPMGPLMASGNGKSDFRQRYALGAHPVVLFLGRHDENKGYHLLLQATQQVWRQRPDTRFVFFGPQTPDSQARFAPAADSRIQVIESPCQQLKRSAIEACDLLCVPSRAESLGVVYLEAWQAGKPVIGGDIAVLRSVIEHNQDGLLCPPEARQIAGNIDRLLADPGLRQRLGMAGKRKVEQQYAWPVIAKTLNAVYRNLASNGREGATAPLTEVSFP